MLLAFHCPRCHAVLKTANPETAGRTFRCPRCNESFVMPTAAERASLAEQLRPTSPPQPIETGRPAAAGIEQEAVSPSPRRLLVVSIAVGSVLLLMTAGGIAYLTWNRSQGSH